MRLIETLVAGSSRALCAFALALLAVLLTPACNRDQSTAGQGGASSGVQSGSGRSPQTENPAAAPDAQPQYGQTGSATISRVVTNVPGHGETGVRGERQPERAGGPAAEPDQVLAERVHVALSTGSTGTTGVYATDMLIKIGVTASNGVVTLTGTVGSEDAKQRLGERARSIAGVKQVNNQLQVSPNNASPGPMPGAPAGRGQNDVVPQNAPETRR